MNVLHNIPLLVPCHSKDLYMSTFGWKAFSNYQEDEHCDEAIIIDLYPGWNWISYLMTTETSLEAALVNLSPNNGDIIKSSSGFRIYNASTGKWTGDLKTLTPGRGYMYLNNSDQTNSFYYPPENPR